MRQSRLPIGAIQSWLAESNVVPTFVFTDNYNPGTNTAKVPYSNGEGYRLRHGGFGVGWYTRREPMVADGDVGTRELRVRNGIAEMRMRPASITPSGQPSATHVSTAC